MGVRQSLVLLGALTLLVCTQAWARNNFVGYTGNPADSGGATCSGCHGGGGYTVTFAGQALVSAGTTSSYTLSNSNASALDFNLSASAGNLTPGPSTAPYGIPGDPYEPGLADSGLSSAYTFDWTAPTTSGLQTIYACMSGSGASYACGTFDVTVQGAPDAVDDDRGVPIGSSANVLAVLDNDTTFDTLAIVNFTAPDNGGSVQIINGGNQLLYSPAQSFSGIETFTYTVQDGLNAMDTATVSVFVAENFPPVDISEPATGYLTAVDLGEAELGATFALAPPVLYAPDNRGPFRPGRNFVQWSATDSNNTTVTATQTVDVLPLLNFDIDQSVEEGDNFAVRLSLNGDAPAYPVTFTVSLGGTANAADYTALGTFDFDSDTVLSVDFSSVANDGTEGEETITFSLSGIQNAAPGTRTTHTVTLVEGNVAPAPTLNVEQPGAGASGPLAIVTGGNVEVTATPNDANGTQTHAFDWSGSDNALVDNNPAANVFSFDPATLEPGVYQVAVTVTDSGSPAASGVAGVLITVRNAFDFDEFNGASSDPADDDGDGVADVDEPFGDQDDDGIPDHLDPLTTLVPGYLMQNQSGDLDAQAFLETEPGLMLRLGDTARRATRYGALITEGDIEAFGGGGGGVADASDSLEHIGGLFDFEVLGLRAGTSARIVLPLSSAMRANSEYRKFTAAGWQPFVEDAANAVSSAASDGVCPGPGAAVYTPGLSPFHDCVQLLIEDGGPNDADGTADGRIADPGGVAFTNVDPPGGESVSDGSALHLGLLLTLAGVHALRAAGRRRRFPVVDGDSA